MAEPMGDTPPPGFVLSERTGPFIDLIGPLYVREAENGPALGLSAEPKHANARGFVHGAILAALLDVVCGRSASGGSGSHPGLVTVSLTIDYVAAARVGDWLEATAVTTKRGRRIAFATGAVRCGDTVVATASAVFAVAEPPTGTS